MSSRGPGTVLLTTKLAPPTPRAGAVPRRDLLARLDAGLEARLTVVVAAAGWGKSTLLAQWMAESGRARFAWVSLDEHDDDPGRFWLYVVAALQRAEPERLGELLELVREPGVAVAEEVLPLLVNGLAGLERPLVLVLDDFHSIRDEAIHTTLGYLLDRLPAGAHVAVAGRTEPPLRLGRRRALGDLSEIRGDRLAFSRSETESLLNGVHGLGLMPDQVARVQERVEGWAAGLQLAALSLKDGPDHAAILDGPNAGRKDFLLDFLWEEVVLRQDRETRHVLMRTAILTRLCGPLCDAVTERPGTAAILADLARSNLFTVALDDTGTWYRYHHLFGELLARRLVRLAPDLVPDLHRRASSWYAAEGMMLEAIDHAISAGDVHYAADEIHRHWDALYSEGHAATLLRWLERLPRDVVVGNPALGLLGAGMARVLGRLEDAERWLATAEQAPDRAMPNSLGSTVRSSVLLVRSAHAGALGRIPEAGDRARDAVAIEAATGGPALLRAEYFLGSQLFWSDDPGESEELLRRFLREAREPPVRVCWALALLSLLATDRGGAREGVELARRAVELSVQHNLEQHSPNAMTRVALAMALLALGDDAAAHAESRRGLTMANRGRDVAEITHALLALGLARARVGATADAADALVRVRELLASREVPRCARLAGGLQAELGSEPVQLPEVALGEPLTDAELRVLRLLPTDLTYGDLAGVLFLSKNTVRTHAQRIRRKLGASSRTETVVRARELGLL